MKISLLARLLTINLILTSASSAAEKQPELTYPIVGTGATASYDNTGTIAKPKPNEPFYGQNSNHPGRTPRYRADSDGTVRDLNTGLIWQKRVIGPMSLEEARQAARRDRTGGYSDWRIPTIKELYSLIQFDTGHAMGQKANSFFIDTRYFDQPLGYPREIDAQIWSCTPCKSPTMHGEQSVFGVNFIDGRIKSYALMNPRKRAEPAQHYFRLVRGNRKYGRNRFTDNGDGTVTDHATGLMWLQRDSGRGMDWASALQWAEELNFAGHSDWRLPDIKELQSLVDYSRSPETTGSAAIDPVFHCTNIAPASQAAEFGYYWSSTTHLDGPHPGGSACYISFGRALGLMRGSLLNVHGAGAQRSDPKSERPAQTLPFYRGPQGDMIRVYNLVRPVRTLRPNESPNPRSKRKSSAGKTDKA